MLQHVPSDIDIAQEAELKPIAKVAEGLGLEDNDWEPYGKHKGKVSVHTLKKLENQPDGKLVLVTSINPTPAGEGKSTVTVGLGQGLNRIGQKGIIALREPSLGPSMGLKGGAAGGGFSQIVPMEDINLHFTGDIHAITSAHNALSAMIDNHIHQGNTLDIDTRRIFWKRVLDINDRALRNIVIGMGGPANGVPREDGFDITVASEIMAILCLSTDLNDLKARLSRMVIAYNRTKQPVTVADLGVEGALTLLLKNAMNPNLVQTLENTPAFVHGGPFANIAHGCNSLVATKMAVKLGDYAVTEAGFGADLGAEKFLDIKSRAGGLDPSAVVIVVTARALKMHGGVDKKDLKTENVEAIKKGMANLEKHIETVQAFSLPFVVAINKFATDTEAELQFIRSWCEDRGHESALADVWAQGGGGGEELAEKVVKISSEISEYQPIYDLNMSIEDKIKAVTQKVYGADGVDFSAKAAKQLKEFVDNGWNNLPICMAKSQYSLSDDPKKHGRPEGFTVHIRELKASIGAGFIVVLTGNVMTMPGLPKQPAALDMDVDVDGRVSGLF